MFNLALTFCFITVIVSGVEWKIEVPATITFAPAYNQVNRRNNNKKGEKSLQKKSSKKVFKKSLQKNSKKKKPKEYLSGNICSGNVKSSVNLNIKCGSLKKIS